MDFYEEKLLGKTVYQGIILDVKVDTVRLPDGNCAKREIVTHPGGVVVLALNRDNQVYMVRQYRYAFSREMLEIPAGKLEPGEDPLEAARRELAEETGVQAARIIPLGPTCPSPGFSSEVLYIYLALGLTEGEAHPDADEFLAVELWDFDALITRVMSGGIQDAKTINALFMAQEWLRRNPDGRDA